MSKAASPRRAMARRPTSTPGHDKPLLDSPRCARCDRALNQHMAGDHRCPNGKRGPTGYASYGPGRYHARHLIPKED